MHKFQKTIRILLTTFLLTPWLLIALLLLAPVQIATAANDSPVGKWRSIDDKTGKAKSIIEITVVDGSSNNELQGIIIELLNPTEQNPLCEKCKGDKANQPITGMIIIWGAVKHNKHWGKGKILDPKNGKTYNVKLSLIDNGQKLKVRGYIGTPVLGRTQIWEKMND